MSGAPDWKKILGTLVVVTKVLLELLDAHANGGDTAEVAHTWRDTVRAHNADALAELAPRPDGDSRCPDCGAYGERAGHMGCPFPQNH